MGILKSNYFASRMFVGQAVNTKQLPAGSLFASTHKDNGLQSSKLAVCGLSV
jgi:vacuolar-type H+-ATPase subunit I/STV1